LNRTIASALDAHLDHEPCELTVEDLLLTFVKPEHQAAARIAGEIYPNKMYGANLFNFSYDPFNTYERFVPTFSVRLDWISTTPTRNAPALPWLPPNYCGQHVNVDNAVAFKTYIHKVLDLALTYNRMALLLKTLNTKCTSAGQLAFIWPAIKQIVDRASEAGEQVDTLKKMVNRRPSGSMPIVTPLMRQWCQETGAALTYLQLMGKAPERHEAHKFAIGFISDIDAIFDKQKFLEL